MLSKISQRTNNNMTFYLFLMKTTEADSGSQEGGAPLQEVTNKESVASIERMGVGHNYWEIRRGFRGKLAFVGRGYYTIFLYVRLVFQFPSPLLINIAQFINLFRQVNEQKPRFDEGAGCHLPL